MKCSSCGADLSPESPTCEFCGSAAELPETPSSRNVFARIKRSPPYERRDCPERHAELPTQSALAKAAPIVFFIVFIGASLFMAAMSAVMAGAVGSPIPLLFSLLPLSFAVLGVFLIFQFNKKRQEFERASSSRGRLLRSISTASTSESLAQFCN